MNEHVNPSAVQTDPWWWWKEACEGRFHPLGDGELVWGYFRARRKGAATDSAVAIWQDSKSGEWRCHMDGQDYDIDRAREIFNYCKTRPVSVEDYGTRVRTGKWPNDHEAVIGHNQAPVDDTAEAIGERIDDLIREAKKMIEAGAAGDKSTADQASDLANTLGEIEGRAVALHKVEKAPILEAGRAIDAKWFNLRDLAAEFKTRLKAVVVTPFLKAQADKVAEQQRLQREAADRAAEAAVQAALAKGESAALAAAQARAQVAAEMPVARNTAGSSKRSSGLRTVTSANVTDWTALLTHLADNEKVREVAQKIADAAAKQGMALPGCEIVKDQRAA